jgi:hypothetical protein
MRKMYNDLRDKGLEVVLVTQPYGYFENSQVRLTPDEEYVKMKEYLEKWELPFPLVIGGAQNFENYGVGGIPHYVVVDRQGKVKSFTIGYNEPLHAALRKSVEEALAQPAGAAEK